ncbi:MAG: 50S ribosomal protein L11 methyltransferase [Oscillospiraceae bacterium]|nr:50S ribosomal protein L11 methyltransferase [Oscillospiraceae bacterium]
MEWTDICITVPRRDAAAAEAIATGISGSGIYVEDYADLEAQVEAIAHVDLIEEELLQKDRSTVLVHMYLAPDEKDTPEIIELLRSRLLAAGADFQLKISGVEQSDWENGWKKYYHAVDVGPRLTVCPSWETPPENRTVLRLDPGMAFGTGTHETTALCLGKLDAIVHGGERMLDVGTGSGILAIAALLLGAREADGIDIDPMCVRTAGENAALNGVQDRFTVRVGDLSEQAKGPYDIVCANIVANAIKMLSPAVPALLAPDGIYITSGIIDDRRDEVAEALVACGFAIEEILEKNGWVCIVARLAK